MSFRITSTLISFLCLLSKFHRSGGAIYTFHQRHKNKLHDTVIATLNVSQPPAAMTPFVTMDQMQFSSSVAVKDYVTYLAAIEMVNKMTTTVQKESQFATPSGIVATTVDLDLAPHVTPSHSATDGLMPAWKVSMEGVKERSPPVSYSVGSSRGKPTWPCLSRTRMESRWREPTLLPHMAGNPPTRLASSFMGHQRESTTKRYTRKCIITSMVRNANRRIPPQMILPFRRSQSL